MILLKKRIALAIATNRLTMTKIFYFLDSHESSAEISCDGLTKETSFCGFSSTNIE